MNPNRDLVEAVSRTVCKAKSRFDGIQAEKWVVESEIQRLREKLEHAQQQPEKLSKEYNRRIINAQIEGLKNIVNHKNRMLNLAKQAYQELLEIEHQVQSKPCREHADIWHHPNERCAGCSYDDGFAVVEESAIE